jgi:SAM-dependent methyltransferase
MSGACRSCGSPLSAVFADLGMTPLSNAFLSADDLNRMEPFYPLRAYVCDVCFLVQLEAFETPKAIFSEYAYFSSYSSSWLEHCRSYAHMAIRRFGLTSASRVVEVASNDGYLLQYFRAASLQTLGIEPAANIAAVAQGKGIRTVVEFLGADSARRLVDDHGAADLVIANNVLAHVPALNDFASGLRTLLKSDGVVTLEFPHLLRLMMETQFDTIYHEHFSYFSLLAAQRVLAAHGLEVFDVEEISTHGGSLRVYATPGGNQRWPITSAPKELIEQERAAGLDRLETYASFAARVKEARRGLLRFLIEVKDAGHTVVGYGAPAKGNTLLNYCGVREDLLPYTVDRSPHKQGRFLPGTHIPIYAPQRIRESKPEYVLILPWNLRDEIVEQMAHVAQWGGKLVIPLPSVQVLDS